MGFVIIGFESLGRRLARLHTRNAAGHVPSRSGYINGACLRCSLPLGCVPWYLPKDLQGCEQ